MFRKLLQMRIFVIIIVIFILLNALTFIGLGAYYSINAIIHIFEGKIGGVDGSHPGYYVLESVDLFLVALVFMILAFGVTKLFLPKQFVNVTDVMPQWLQVSNFSELKVLLWEAILLALVVLYVGSVIKNQDKMDWSMVILPLGILVLAISVWLMKQGEHETQEEEENETSHNV